MKMNLKNILARLLIKTCSALSTDEVTVSGCISDHFDGHGRIVVSSAGKNAELVRIKIFSAIHALTGEPYGVGAEEIIENDESISACDGIIVNSFIINY